MLSSFYNHQIEVSCNIIVPNAVDPLSGRPPHPLAHHPLPKSPVQCLTTLPLSVGRPASTSYDGVHSKRDRRAYTLHYILRIVNGSLSPAVNPADPLRSRDVDATGREAGHGVLVSSIPNRDSLTSLLERMLLIRSLL